MDLKKIQSLENLTPLSPGKTKTPGISSGPSFQETLSQLEGGGTTAVSSVSSGNLGTGVSGIKSLNSSNSLEGIKFSNHAIDRMRSRGISFNPQDLSRLNDAVGRAAAKGSKDSLILMNDSALIVSVKNNTVVTVMDKNALKENVFTNIDSTIVM